MDRGLLNEFIHYLKFEKRYAQHTISAYQKDLEQFAQYLHSEYNTEDLLSVTHFQVRSWLAGFRENNMQPRSINRKISSLSSFYKHLMRLGRVDKNPTDLVHAQKLPKRLPMFIKEQETNLLLEEIQFDEGFAGATERLICELLYATGMRRSELIGLKENDIEWSMKQIRVLGKGGKERLIPVSVALLDALKDYIALKKHHGIYSVDHLLACADGGKLYPIYVYRVVKKYLTQVTTLKKRSPHILRHTFATHLLNNGANIQAIKELLGHSSLAATQVYTHTSIEKLKNIHKLNHPRG